MAKVRVYELAKELNVESKALVDKLRSSGINVKNYMSALDEDSARKARDLVSVKPSEIIEEKRIRPTVIRRRKKQVTVEAREEEGPQDEKIGQVAQVSPEEIEGRDEGKEIFDEKGEDVLIEEEKKQEVTVQSLPQEQAAEEKIEEEVPDKVKPKEKRARKKKKEMPARIIKLPERKPLKEVTTKEEELVTLPIETVTEQKPSELPGPAVTETEEESEERPGKKRKDRKKAGKKEKEEKIPIRHRKLEVFERADLYEGRKPRLKERTVIKKGKEVPKRLRQTEITVPKAIKRRLKVQEEVTIAELAKAMGVKSSELIKKLMAQGVMATINLSLDFETASLVADEFGYELELEKFDTGNLIEVMEDTPQNLKPRPPVVTIMGHVDHGKTSLLDYIRNSNIAGGESGGITQHIGAYYVKGKGGDIVFLDTPGHEAFTAMRARGAKVTDIIILVVAADDGVMPQTKEAVNHARAAGIPIIVAINKIDKPEANPDKVIRELAEIGLAPEQWGGDTIFGKISAKTGEGVGELLELILLQAEILELKANPDKNARGTIIEAKLDKSKGSVATVLIKSGTLKQSDYFICGETYGRIRAMIDHMGKKIKSAGPSVPVEIYGISGVPMAGDEMIVVKDEKSAKHLVEHRHAKMKSKELSRRDIVSLEDLFNKIKEGAIKELNIVLKTDVQGSLEALSDSLIKLSTDEVKVKMIHSSTGAISETDVMLASASNAIVIGFNVRANPRVIKIAEKEKVDIRYYNVIYNVLEDIRMAMTGLLEPVFKEKVIGRADIKEIFNVPKIGTVAGCIVTDGFIERNARVRLLRDEVVIFEGSLASLRRFKNDVKDVQSGYECGIGLEGYQDIKPGDVFEVYQLEEVAAEL